VCGARDACAQRLPSDFVAAYGPALERMRSTYAEGTVRGTISMEYPTTGRSIDRRFTLRLAGNVSRIDSSVTAQHGMDVRVGGTDIFLAQPGASMQSYRNDSGEIANRPFVEDGYNQATSSIRDLMPIAFPYTMGGRGTILTMLQSGDVKITSFKRGSVDGERMIQIKYIQQVDPDGRRGPWNAELMIAPEEGYALRQFSRTAGRGEETVTTSGTLSYSLNADGVPLLRQFEQTEARGAAATIVEQRTFGISEFSTEPPKSYLFSADGF
jgi:hypothetical protein